MATITFTIPDAQIARVVDAFAVAYGYQDTITNPVDGTTSPNPETSAQFMRRQIMVFIKNTVQSIEVLAAAEAARAAELAKPQVGVS